MWFIKIFIGRLFVKNKPNIQHCFSLNKSGQTLNSEYFINCEKIPLPVTEFKIFYIFASLSS